MKKQYLLLTLILLFLSIGAFQPFGCQIAITGTVTDQAGNTVEGATVSIEGFTPATTGADGTYRIENVTYGEYTIIVSYNDETTTKAINTIYFINGITCEEIDGNIQFTWWKEIGTGSAYGSGISSNSGESGNPSIAINSSGNPVVAWMDSTSTGAGSFNTYLKQWNGTSWEELDGSASGGGINTTGDSSYPSLAMNDSGNPVVAWSNSSLGIEIYLKQWDGDSWEELGGSGSGRGISNTSGISSNPSLLIDNSGNPVVAWSDRTSGNWEIYLKQWNGTSWEELDNSASSGGISNNNSDSERPSVAINVSGSPVVAWDDNTSGNYEIYVKQWNGSTWEEIGGSASGGGISNTSLDSFGPSLAINNSGNIVIAWADDTSGKREIYIKQWKGSSWEELGSGSASSGGISNTSSWSNSPSLAINSSGNPVVAWDDIYISQIYLKQWNGSNWEELGGSASGGGINDNSGLSVDPSIAINSLGNPVVAWEDYTSGNYEIYIKQWVPDE